LSGKDSYPEITVGPGLQRLLRPGRLCIEGGECGWLVIRKRRNQYYVYLDTGRGEVYLGPLARFQPAPTVLLLRLGDGRLVLDVEPAPKTPRDIIGVVKALALIASSLPRIEKLLSEVLTKYKVGR